jgi:hypothetical protein
LLASVGVNVISAVYEPEEPGTVAGVVKENEPAGVLEPPDREEEDNA